MNNEPWFNLDSASARLYQMVKDAEQEKSVKAFPEGREPVENDDAECKQPDNDYADDEAIRFGNNRKHVKGAVAKAKRKMAKKSKQRNRK